MTDLFSYAAEGARLRDKGIARVQANHSDWSERAYQQLVRLARVRPELHSNDMLAFDPPPNRYASGGIWIKAIKRGLLVDTGRTLPSRDPKKHSKKTPVYRSTIYGGQS